MSKKTRDKKDSSETPVNVSDLGLKPECTGLGRRKTSVARVWLYPDGNKKLADLGGMLVNGKPVNEYFPGESSKQQYLEPLFACALPVNKVAFSAKVSGGGISGQLGALRLGIARAILSLDESYREPLRKRGLLTRDSRMVESKKYYRHKARRSHQFSKR